MPVIHPSLLAMPLIHHLFLCLLFILYLYASYSSSASLYASYVFILYFLCFQFIICLLCLLFILSYTICIYFRYLVIPISLHVSEVEGGSDAQRSGAAHNVRDEPSANYSKYHYSPDHIVVMSRAAVTRSEAKWLTMSETNNLLTA